MTSGELDGPLDVIAFFGFEAIEDQGEQVFTIFHWGVLTAGVRAVLSAVACGYPPYSR
jgi:hypothetical protein